jgi:hypothetical protein
MKALTLQSTDLLRLMQSDWTRHAIRLLNLLLVVWIAWLLSAMTWSILNKTPPVETVLPEAVPVTPQVSQQEELVRQLPNWHLFGEAAQEAEPVKQAVPVDAPIRVLTDIARHFLPLPIPILPARSSPMNAAMRKCMRRGYPARRCRTSEIQSDKVILLRGGRYETLRLPREETAGGGMTISVATESTYNPEAVDNSTSERLQSLRQTLKRIEITFRPGATIPKRMIRAR